MLGRFDFAEGFPELHTLMGEPAPPPAPPPSDRELEHRADLWCAATQVLGGGGEKEQVRPETGE